MFLPTTSKELEKLGWTALDIILVTGDSYVDSPFIGVSVVGQVLLKAGYRVGIIAQPDPKSDDIGRLGEPELFWGVSGGSIDSMVANYTATKKRKNTFVSIQTKSTASYGFRCRGSAPGNGMDGRRFE